MRSSAGNIGLMLTSSLILLLALWSGPEVHELDSTQAPTPDLCSYLDENGRPKYCASGDRTPPPCTDVDAGAMCPAEQPLVCCAGSICWSVDDVDECPGGDLGSCAWGIEWADGTVTCWD